MAISDLVSLGKIIPFDLTIDATHTDEFTDSANSSDTPGATGIDDRLEYGMHGIVLAHPLILLNGGSEFCRHVCASSGNDDR